jgi:hypothetical protein
MPWAQADTSVLIVRTICTIMLHLFPGPVKVFILATPTGLARRPPATTLVE